MRWGKSFALLAAWQEKASAHWQLKPEGASLSHHALHTDATAMGFDRQLAEGQAQASAEHNRASKKRFLPINISSAVLGHLFDTFIFRIKELPNDKNRRRTAQKTSKYFFDRRAVCSNISSSVPPRCGGH
jgi:hypothetical protein